MINLMKAAIRGVKAELAAGQSGWEVLVGGVQLPLAGRTSKAGTVVSAESAMSLSTVWACVSKTASLVASLPLDMYERGPNGRRSKVTDDDLGAVLTMMPNREQTDMEFWESMVAHMVLRGNGVAERLKIGNRTVGLRPLINCDPRRNSDGDLEYPFWDRGKKEVLPADKVFHLRGFGAGDGIGLSAIQYGVQSLGAALAAEETAASFFSNSMMPSGVITGEQTLTDVQRTQMGNYLATYTGSTKAGKVMVLEAGFNFNQLQVKPEDAQLLETRQFNVADGCRWFGVPPVIIGHSSEGQTMYGTGVEAIMLAWLTLGINPLLTRIERRILRDLVLPEKGRKFFFEYNREAMLQMDSKAKAELLSKLFASGMITADEGRAKLNLQARGGAADVLMAQGAMAPLETLKGHNP
jgi:HK97 family phage portal protein